MPQHYDDLLKPEFKDQIVIPDPRTSATSYCLLFERVKTLGDQKAKAYFDALSKNVKQFTTSGSAPVNLLIQGE